MAARSSACQGVPTPVDAHEALGPAGGVVRQVMPRGLSGGLLRLWKHTVLEVEDQHVGTTRPGLADHGVGGERGIEKRAARVVGHDGSVHSTSGVRLTRPKLGRVVLRDQRSLAPSIPVHRPMERQRRCWYRALVLVAGSMTLAHDLWPQSEIGAEPDRGAGLGHGTAAGA